MSSTHLASGCETLRNTYPGAFPEPTDYSASVSGDVGRRPVVMESDPPDGAINIDVD